MASPISFRDGGFALLEVGEYFFGPGLLSLTVGLGLSQFVIIGLFGLWMAFTGLILLTIAIILTRSPTVSALRRWVGLGLALVGLAFLVGTAGQALSVAYDRVRYAWQPLGPAPTGLLWPWLVLAGPSATAVLALGLWLRAGWLQGRLLFWAMAATLVGPVAVSLFMTLATPSLLDA
jgi:hypothetical protein